MSKLSKHPLSSTSFCSPVLLVALAAAASSASCNKSDSADSSGAQELSKPIDEASPRTNAVDIAPKDAAPERSPVERMQAYGDRLSAGRKSYREGKFEEAMKRFHSAIEAHPGARAFSELGLAAFHASNLDMSIVASRSALQARDPRIAASSYYNLAMAQEAKKQPHAARQSLQRSLLMRPHPATQERLDALTAEVPPWQSPMCGGRSFAQAQLAACAKLPAAAKNALFAETKGELRRLEVPRSDITRGDINEQLLVIKLAPGQEPGEDLYRVIANLGALPIAKADEEVSMQISTFARHEYGDKEVLRIETLHRESGSPLTGQASFGAPPSVFRESFERTQVLFCLLGAQPRCSRAFPLSSRWSARIDKGDESALGTLFQQIYDQPPPANFSYAMDVDLDAQGKVTVTAHDGAKSFRSETALW